MCGCKSSGCWPRCTVGFSATGHGSAAQHAAHAWEGQQQSPTIAHHRHTTLAGSKLVLLHALQPPCRVAGGMRAQPGKGRGDAQHACFVACEPTLATVLVNLDTRWQARLRVPKQFPKDFHVHVLPLASY